MALRIVRQFERLGDQGVLPRAKRKKSELIDPIFPVMSDTFADHFTLESFQAGCGRSSAANPAARKCALPLDMDALPGWSSATTHLPTDSPGMGQ